MKISRFITIGCTSFFLGVMAHQLPSHSQHFPESQLIAQSDNQDTSSVIQMTAEKMIKSFFAKDFESLSSTVVSELKESVTKDKMEQAWQETIDENGDYIKIVNSQVIETPSSDLVSVTIEFEQVTEDWIFVFNDNQEIIGLNSPLSKPVQEIADEFINAVIKADYNKARSYFHPFLKETIFPRQIENSWNKLIAENGKFQNITSTKLRRGSTLDITDLVIVDLEFGKGEQEILIIFDNSKNIIGVDFVEQ